MRSIDYFDRGHDRDPSRLAIIDTASGLKLTFAEVKERLKDKDDDEKKA